MKLKGIDKLYEKLPDYPGKRLVILPIFGLLVLLLGLAFMLVLDTVSRLMPGVPLLAALEPLLPVLGSVITVGAGISFVRRLWTKRDEAKAKLGELAYQRMVLRGLTGVFLLFSALIHSFISVRSLPPGPPVNDITTQLSTSFLSMVGVPVVLDVGLRIIGGGLLLLVAVLTAARALFTFGFDYMIVVYLYFPEESEIQNHEIYSVVRHPAYFSLALASLAAILSRMSIYSIVLAFVIFVGLLTHIKLEEAELVERFGNSYSEYMKKVPGLYIRRRDIRSYFRFLVGRSKFISDTD
ncbi:MAG: methyltransferase family protein [Candidatus Hermodarchaeota archaeon]